MRKFLSVALSAAMIGTLLAGCSSSSSDTQETTAASEQTETTAAAGESGEAAAGEALNIAIVSSPSGVDDGSFNEDNYNGILAFIETHPDSKVTPVREETGDTAAAVQAVADIVADYDVIVCCGYRQPGCKLHPGRLLPHRCRRQRSKLRQYLRNDLCGAGERILRRNGCSFRVPVQEGCCCKRNRLSVQRKLSVWI